MKNRTFSNGKLVPVSIGGITIRVDPTSIGKDNRTPHHGEFKGVKVNSPETFQIGDSVILWPEAGKPLAISIGKAALGVLATQFLQAEGKHPY